VAADLLVFVRHARPVVEPGVPSSSWKLGEEGLAGAARLAPALVGLGIDLVVSSVEPKAVDTARVLAEVLDVPWQTGHDLHEHERPGGGGLPEAEFQASMRRFFDSPSTLVFGAETADVAFARVSGAVDALVRVHRGKRLCVVTHGTVLSLLLGRRYGVDAQATWRALGMPAMVVVDQRTRTVVDVVRSV
jgi:broad specificity phosphatase PhoE